MVDAASKSQVLHVANGTATTTLIAAAGIPGQLSIWADPLYDGPVPDVGDHQLRAIRAAHLAGPGEDAVDAVNDLRNWRAAIDGHHSYDELILWYEHDLFDQLNLIQLLDWIRTRVPGDKVVSLVCVGSFPGRPKFKGLGELTPPELGSLLPARQRVTDAHYSSAAAAWRAFRQPTPEPLDDLRGQPSPALPYLAPALTRFLQEYPWTTDGLSRSERRLLQLASTGGINLGDAFPRMHEGEDAYYITDLSLSGLAETLSRMSPPLLMLTPAEGEQCSVLSGRVVLTEAGNAILAGEQDRVEIAGIDRWLGGVHLQAGGPLWRWHPGRQQIVRT